MSCGPFLEGCAPPLCVCRAERPAEATSAAFCFAISLYIRAALALVELLAAAALARVGTVPVRTALLAGVVFVDALVADALTVIS